MRENPKAQEIYRHFKGNLYQVLTLAKQTETEEVLVIYQALYGDFAVYARGLSNFLSMTDKVKYPEAEQAYRFEKVTFSLGEVSALKEESGLRENFGLKGESDVRKAPALKEDSNGRETSDSKPENVSEEDRGLKEAAASEEWNIDPLVVEFLDADSYEERLNILAALHSRITDEMINTMAVAADLEIEEGGVEERYQALKNCLLTLEKYECNRLR